MWEHVADSVFLVILTLCTLWVWMMPFVLLCLISADNCINPLELSRNSLFLQKLLRRSFFVLMSPGKDGAIVSQETDLHTGRTFYWWLTENPLCFPCVITSQPQCITDSRHQHVWVFMNSWWSWLFYVAWFWLVQNKKLSQPKKYE